MNRLTGVAAIVSALALIGSVQYAYGAAVMSIDLGCEWMKVSHCFMVHKNSSRYLTLMVFREFVIGWYRVTWRSNGNRVE